MQATGKRKVARCLLPKPSSFFAVLTNLLGRGRKAEALPVPNMELPSSKMAQLSQQSERRAKGNATRVALSKNGRPTATAPLVVMAEGRGGEADAGSLSKMAALRDPDYRARP